MSSPSTQLMSDEMFDNRLRAFLALEATETMGAPSAIEIADRIGARSRPRFGTLSPQLVWLILIGLLMAALISAVWVGSRLRRPPELLPISSTATEVAPGWYYMPAEYTPQSFGFDLPAGWSTKEGFVFKGGRQQVRDNEVQFVAWPALTHVFGHVCETGALLPVSTNADELVNVLAGQGGREVVGPEDVTVDGRAGKLVHLTVPADLTCAFGSPRIWPDPGPQLSGGMLTAAGRTDDVYAFDLDSGRLVMVASYSADASAQNRQQLASIVESVRFLL